MIAVLLAWASAAPSRPCGAGPTVVKGHLQASKLHEASGVVASRRQPGVLWMHNDSGDKARVFAVGPAGEHLGDTDLDDVDAVDFEDIALLPGQSHDWLLVGDLGDNDHRRDQVAVHRLAEPKPGTEEAPVETMVVRYPEGHPNAETLLVDPSDAQIYVLTKVKKGPSTLYRLGPWRAGEVTAERVAEVTIEGATPRTTGGDTRPGQVAIRTYTHVLLFRGDTVPEALARPACVLPWAEERQGEALTFGPDGLISVSEGKGSPIHEVSISSE